MAPPFTADTSAMDELNLDDLFGNGDSAFDADDLDFDLKEIGEIGDLIAKEEAVSADMAAKNCSKKSSNKKRVTTSTTKIKSKKSKTSSDGQTTTTNLSNKPDDDAGISKKSKKKKIENDSVIAEELNAAVATVKTLSAVPNKKALPQSLSPQSEVLTMQMVIKTTTLENVELSKKNILVKKSNKKKRSPKKEDTGPDPHISSSVADKSTYLHSTSSFNEQLYQQRQQAITGAAVSHLSNQNLSAMTMQYLEQMNQVKVADIKGPAIVTASSKPKLDHDKKEATKQNNDELPPSNTEFFPFVEMPNSINIASRKFCRAFPKLDVIYSATCDDQKASSTQPADSNSSIASSEQHRQSIQPKVMEELSKMDQNKLVGELKEVLVLLHRQKSFFDQSNANMQRWCKLTFDEKEYKKLYPNEDIQLIEHKAVALTAPEVVKELKTKDLALSAGENTAVAIPRSDVSPIDIPKKKSTVSSEIPLTAINAKIRQTLREKFQSITTTKFIKVKIKCTQFKPPFIFNEKTQKKENMKLVAHILPEKVAAEIALKKALAIEERKQQSALQRQHQQYDVRSQITMAAQTAKNIYEKKFQNVASAFKKKMSSLNDQVENEQMANIITAWRVLEDSYCAIDSFGGSCAAKKIELIRFALNGVWQPELPVRVGWRESPVMRLHHYRENRNHGESHNTTSHAASKFDGACVEEERKRTCHQNDGRDNFKKIKVNKEDGEIMCRGIDATIENAKICSDINSSAKSNETEKGHTDTSVKVSVVCENAPDARALQNSLKYTSPLFSGKTLIVDSETKPIEPISLTSQNNGNDLDTAAKRSTTYSVAEPEGKISALPVRRRVMPSLFDRLQSLLVEVDGWSSDEACDTESEDEVELFSGVEEVSTKERHASSSLAPVQLLDLSQLTLDQRVYIQLRAARLVDTSFIPRPTPLVEDCEWVSEDEDDNPLPFDQLAAEVSILQKQLSHLHRSNNETIGFLQSEALAYVSSLAKEYKYREEQAAICAKSSQLVQKRKKETKQRPKTTSSTNKKDPEEWMPW